MPISDHIRRYCEEVRRIRSDPDHQPESSLYEPLGQVLRNVLREIASQPDIDVVHQAHTTAGAPDFKVARHGRPTIGFVEAKPPNNTLRHRSGHDKVQFESYSDLPNWIYTNYHRLELYAGSELVGEIDLVPRRALDPNSNLDRALRTHDASAAVDLLRRFVHHVPPAVATPKDAAQALARAARLVRTAVRQAIALSEAGAVREVRDEFRAILSAPLDGDESEFDARFADAYAQTLAYGLLMARVETSQSLTATNAINLISAAHHPLLRAALRLMTLDEVRLIIGWSLDVLVDWVNSIDPAILIRREDRDPVLYFYEDFFAAYAPEERQARGVFYTPPSVVGFQVRSVHRLLKEQFGLSDGLLNPLVHILDPAVGTGTYLIACLQEAAEEARTTLGPAAVPQAVTAMLDRLYGFEILVGPYTVAHYRLQAAAAEYGVSPRGRLNVFLTDTLAQPGTSPGATHFAFLSEPLLRERAGADQVKTESPILVILGNPPYNRSTGLKNDWMYRSPVDSMGRRQRALLDDFRDPVSQAGLGKHLKSLSDPYAYFYRWALWRLFESPEALRQGVLTFITNRSWLQGEAFGGLRKMLRERFSDGWIVDLHGDSRAALPAGIQVDKNVFEIQAGVAIGVFSRPGGSSIPATLRFTECYGTLEEKEDILANYLSDLAWQPVEGAGIDEFLPSMAGTFSTWPRINEVFLFNHSGTQTKRDHLVVAPTRPALIRRLRRFAGLPQHEKRAEFHETPSRTSEDYQAFTGREVEPHILRYQYRFLDREFIYYEPHFIDRPRPLLKAAWGDHNTGIATLPRGIGSGQAVVAVSELPDISCFRGSFTSQVFPIYDRRQAALDPEHQANIRPHVTAALGRHFGGPVSAEDVFHYTYALLACEDYANKFAAELRQSFPRVPFTKDPDLFRRAMQVGERMVRLHTFQERRPANTAARLHGSTGRITPPRYDTQRLTICADARVEPVTAEAWGYRVSGYPVLQRWVERRVDLELDLESLQELLHVIYILEETVAARPTLSELLDAVLAGETFSAEELGVADSSATG